MKMIKNNLLKNDTISNTQKHKNTLFWVLIVMVSFVLVHIFTLFYGITLVSGDSMNPTLHNNELHIYSTDLSNLKKSDIIIFRNKYQTNQDIYIKRVIAMPGDTIKCVGTKVYLNNELLNENYIKQPVSEEFYCSYTIGNDELFVCGDNRNNSYDSRNFGPINTKDVIGIIKK